jgi:hypothetical protein
MMDSGIPDMKDPLSELRARTAELVAALPSRQRRAACRQLSKLSDADLVDALAAGMVERFGDAAAAQMLLGVAARSGEDGQGQGGLAGYLRRLKRDDPAVFELCAGDPSS